MRLFIIILTVIIGCGFSEANSNILTKKPDRKCGYGGCPKLEPNMLNVHVVAHTHDDVGWLKTVDQYYYGTKQSYQRANVKLILDTVIGALLKDPTKRFIYVESAFFFKWWSQQSEALKQLVKQLVNEGRLEFIGGAWSMNDEATTHYQGTIDQFTWGLRKLNDSFGECGRPKIGWQIDPFGHSREFASLLAQMGYDGLFMGRIDHEDKDKRLSSKTGEMIWHASENLGSKADLFTGVLYNGYSSPPGFCYDYLCSFDPLVDDKNSPEYNIDTKIEQLYRYFATVQSKYRTNNILITFGDDFHYQVADMWFSNLDILIRNMNKAEHNGQKVNMFYSTPSCYLKSLHEANITWPTKTDDFFPYSSDSNSFWTGYYTSRPTLKRFERVGNHNLQVCKQLTAMAKKQTPKFEENLNNLREIMGVMQHHDAVSGTEKQHVAEDYARLLNIGIEKCNENVKEALNQLITKKKSSQTKSDNEFNPKVELNYFSCADLNISSCSVTEENDKFITVLYNPLGHSTSQYVRIPVSAGDYDIFDHQNSPVSSQLVPIPSEVQSLSYRRSNANMELVFLAHELPPLGFKSYSIQRKSRSADSIKLDSKTPIVVKVLQNDVYMNDDDPTSDDYPSADDEVAKTDPFTIGNNYFNLSFDENGLLASAANGQARMKVKQNFYLYEGHTGYPRSSGAYVFRPNTAAPRDIVNHAAVKVIRGDLVDEVHQTFNEWISQVVRVYKNENYAEFQWLVGPIPIEDNVGREIITRFDTDIKSNGIFYTDSNGREMLKRKRDHRDTWDVNLFEKVSGNYYPINAKIAIEDKTRRFAILPDRSQGGSSLADGSVELMLHRRLLKDDGFGVGEALNEKAFGKGLIARGSSYFVFGPKKSNQNDKLSTKALERFIQLKTLLPSSMYFVNTSDSVYDHFKISSNHVFSGMSESLPKNVHLLSFEPWKDNWILVRFEHIFEKNEDKNYSQRVSFDVRKVFGGLNIVSMRETTLSANQWIGDAKRLHFTAETNESSAVALKHTRKEIETKTKTSDNIIDQTANEFLITLNPMEIRTFIIQLK